MKYAKIVSQELTKNNIRNEIDERNETLSSKVRDAQLEKVAYMLILGDKEKETESVAVRKRNEEDLGSIKLNEFISLIQKEIKEKSIT